MIPAAATIMQEPDRPLTTGRRLRLLSFNMQVGMPTAHYGHYVTGAWRHVLPSRSVRRNLDRIAELARDYDVVALQEADAGSLRTASVNQIEYLARRAGFQHWRLGVNRDLGPFAQHAIGLLSREPLHEVRHHPLPGPMRGRGALEATILDADHHPLQLVVAHLALSRGARARQLHHLAELARPDEDTLLLGDLNCEPDEIAAHPELRRLGFRIVHETPTYPSWQPRRSIDHVLASPSVLTQACLVLPDRLSDHLAVSTEVRLRPR